MATVLRIWTGKLLTVDASLQAKYEAYPPDQWIWEPTPTEIALWERRMAIARLFREPVGLRADKRLDNGQWLHAVASSRIDDWENEGVFNNNVALDMYDALAVGAGRLITGDIRGAARLYDLNSTRNIVPNPQRPLYDEMVFPTQWYRDNLY